MKNTKIILIKKAISVFLSLILVMGLVPEAIMTVSAATSFSYIIDDKMVTVNDTDADGFYEISTADELYAFSLRIEDNQRNINAKLMKDIVFNENVTEEMSKLEPDYQNFRRFFPIGYNYYRPFNGIFDGNNKTVSGLFYLSENDDSNSYRGMFGTIEGKAVVKNLTVADSYFHSETAVGAIVGNNESGCKIINCASIGNIISGTSEIGGIVGDNNGTVTECRNTSVFAGEPCYAGGICGRNDSVVEKCYNVADLSGRFYIGGIVGKAFNNSDVKNCYNLGNISGSSYGIAGLIGSNDGYVNNCYSLGNVESEDSQKGALVGLNTGENNIINSYYLSSSDDGIGGKTEAQFKSGEVAYLLQNGVASENGVVPQIWGQNIDNGNENETRPIYSNAIVNYGYATVSCEEISPFTNKTVVTTERLAHNYENAVCTLCKKECFHINSTYYSVDNDNTHSLKCSICNLQLENSEHNFVTGICDKCEFKKDYRINVNADIENGIVTIDKKKANVGDTVTVNVQPDTAYAIKSVTLTYEGYTVEISGNSFVMPAFDVEINAVFTQICFHKGNTDTDDHYDYHSFICEFCGAEIVNEEHSGGTASCIELAKCDICGDEYGYLEYYNHSGEKTVEFEWDKDNSTDSCWVNAYLYCNDCNEIISSNYAYAEKTALVTPDNCLQNGYEEWSVTIELEGVEYTESKTFKIKSENHIGSFENGFCTGCGGYQPAEDLNGDGYYEIDNAGKLFWFADYINNYSNELYVIVTKNITIPSGKEWTPIMDFYGEFNGNFKTISGLHCVSDDDYIGMFGGGYYSYGTIKNLHISNSTFKGNSYVGAIAGLHSGNIENCFTDSTVTVKGTNSTGTLIGHNSGSIINCYAYSNNAVGYFNENYSTVRNVYYLSSSDDGIGGKTEAQFKSGEVAFLLQSGVEGEWFYDEETDEWITLSPAIIWGQSIGTENYPVLGGKEVYLIKKCDGISDLYSNLNIETDHDFVNGACTVCGVVQYDVNKDTFVDILDLIKLKNNLINENGYDRIADIDSNGVINSLDCVFLKKHLFEML